VPGEHDVIDEENGKAYLDRYGKNTKGTGWYSFDAPSKMQDGKDAMTRHRRFQKPRLSPPVHPVLDKANPRHKNTPRVCGATPIGLRPPMSRHIRKGVSALDADAKTQEKISIAVLVEILGIGVSKVLGIGSNTKVLLPPGITGYDRIHA
jgi:hypothetical protein